jgi:hypothetical protein
MPLMSALFVTDVNVITYCPLAFAGTVNCWMLAILPPRGRHDVEVRQHLRPIDAPPLNWPTLTESEQSKWARPE